jgi:hypothetical protein
MSQKSKEQSYLQRLPLCFKTDKIITNQLNDAAKIIKNGKFHYPLTLLKTTQVINPPNILIIGIDAWRADYFNEYNSPNLWNFTKKNKGKIFYNHKSGSNRTWGGIFSLFYSLPESYWNNVLVSQQKPIFFDRLQQLNYQISMFTPASTPLPDFINEKNLENADLNFIFSESKASKNDEMATNNLLKWYKNRDKNNPWFSFIFYCSARSHDFPDGYSKNYNPIKKEMRYQNIINNYGEEYFIKSYSLGVHYADHLAGEILNKLEEDNDLGNTVILITADLQLILLTTSSASLLQLLTLKLRI